MATEPTNEELNTKLTGEIILIKSQSTWPYDDKVFIGILFAAVIFLIVPFLLMMPAVPEKARNAMDFLTYCKSTARWIGRMLYGVP